MCFDCWVAARRAKPHVPSFAVVMVHSDVKDVVAHWREKAPTRAANAKMQSGKTRGNKLTVPWKVGRRVLQVVKSQVTFSEGLFVTIKTNMSGCAAGFEFDFSVHLLSRRDFPKWKSHLPHWPATRKA